MNPALKELPDDIDALKAMVVAMAEKAARAEALEADVSSLTAANADLAALNAAADERIARLTSIIKMFERARYGKSSEKRKLEGLDDEQYALVFEEVETGLSAIRSELAKARGRKSASRSSRPRKGFAPHLERVEVVIEPEEQAGMEGVAKVRIGEDVSERLDVTPAQFRVIVTRRPKYAYKPTGQQAEGSEVIQAPAPNRIIEGGIPTEALLAHVAVSKYADGLPLYRQAAIYARSGVELDRSILAQWMGKVGFELEPLAHYLLSRIKQGERIFADETTLPTLAPGSGQTKTAYLWTYARDDSPFGGTAPPMVAYLFEDSRSGACPERHLDGYRGILQVDGYAAYNRLAKADRANDGVLLAGCWSHVRRKFYELHAAGSSQIASRTVEIMSRLWAIEDGARGQDQTCRLKARQQSAPIVAELFEMWEATLPRIPRKSTLAEAIRYAIARRSSLERFLADGRIELDSNIVERAIRPQTITRKNSLFAGSDGGGRTWATIASLLTTAKMNGVDPHAWLTQTLERIAKGWPNSEIGALMPWNFAG
jgi:transposase